ARQRAPHAAAAARRSRRSADRPRTRAPLARLLVARGEFLHLWPQHQRPHRHTPDPRLDGARHPRGHGGELARLDRSAGHHRYHRLRLALGPLDNRYLLCWYYGLRGLSLLFLPYAFGSAYLGLAAFVIFYGLDWVATVPPTARLAADTFGRENVGIMFGWIVASHQLGAATAAYGGGLLHTWLGDYQVTFMSAGLLCLIAAGLVLR